MICHFNSSWCVRVDPDIDSPMDFTEGWSGVPTNDIFIQRSLVFGHPPKVILLSVGNSLTRDLITFLTSRALIIYFFTDESEESLLVLTQ